MNMTDGKLGFLYRIPVFWKHLMMMVCIVIIAVCTLVISNRISLQNLTEENLKNMQLDLSHNSQALSDRLYAAYSIPEIIENTQYYTYIRRENAASMPDKYAAILLYLSKSLHKQTNVLGNYEQCFLYLSGTNSICGSKRNYYTAEDCFTEYITFSETGQTLPLELMRTRNVMALLPMQEILIGGESKGPCLTLITFPRNASSSIMALYRQEEILSLLGMDAMPEGTHLCITDEQGNVLIQYPAPVNAEIVQNSNVLSSRMQKLRAEVTVWIPREHFSRILAPAQHFGWFMVAVMAILGMALCFVLSKFSAQPLRRLGTIHGAWEDQPHANEIVLLDKLIRDSKQETETLQQMLISNLLVRCLSGGVLSGEEEQQLRGGIDQFQGIYRIAILHTEQEITQRLASGMLRTLLPEDFSCTLISQTEYCTLFASSEENLQKLQTCVETLNGLLREDEPPILCGVSGPADGLRSIHAAVRQARSVLPTEGTMAIFWGEPEEAHTVSWLQHERLYQSILANQMELAESALQIIARQAHISSVTECYYNVCFVLRCAAEELGISSAELQLLGIDHSLLPRENILRLTEPLRRLFALCSRKEAGEEETLRLHLLSWLRENSHDCNLCAASAAEHFGISKPRVYEMMRQQTGKSFNAYLLTLRMKRAGTLLCVTQLSVGDVARRVGYQAESTFYRVFKNYYGVSPNQYRKDGGKPD